MADIKRHDNWDYHRYIVEGRGEFPFDMLRHSESWPGDAESAFAMGNWSDKRRIMLIARNGRWVSPARWESFNWKIIAGMEMGYPAEIDDYHGIMAQENAA